MSNARDPHQPRSLDALFWPDDIGATMHDAMLLSITINYAAAHAELVVRVCVGDPRSSDAREREARRIGMIEADGLTVFSIEPPADRHWGLERKGLWIDADVGDPNGGCAFTKDGAEQQDVDTKVEFWIYVHHWNSFMRVECDRVCFRWSDAGNGGG